MKVKFFIKEGNNITFREMEVSGLEDNPLKPYIVINEQKFMRKDLLSKLEYIYETDQG